MQIVISHQELVGFGGTESYLVTVAEGLERLGHDVVIHARELGPAAHSARERGLRVEERESRLPPADAVLAQDASTAYTLAGRYPDAARVFVAHSAGFALQSPPQAEAAAHAVVVMNDRLLRRTAALAHRVPTVRLRQPIDLQRFCFGTLAIEPRHPPRVLLLSNYTKGPRARMVEQACAAAGLQLDRVGAKTVATPTPELDIAAAAIVVSLGRGALEAMAGGRAAYILGDAGGDGWVTPETYAALEADGFSGRALGEAVGAERLAADLARYREEMGELNRDLACQHHAAVEHCVELVELLERVGASGSEPTTTEELARLVRLEWSQSMGVRQANARTDAERARVAELEEEVAALRARLDATA